MSENNKKSPLKEKPRRQAGQSVEEERQRVLDDELTPYFAAALIAILFAAFEWHRWWADIPVRPVPATIVAAIVVLYSALKIRGTFQRLRNLRLGRDGERLVGEFLERLREKGCVVFHDIIAGDFNIDHVVVSEKGIFVIETKTYSKPFSDAKVRSDGKHILCDGLGDQTHIVDQAKGNARWTSKMLKESTGRGYYAKPVILFPGWYVERECHDDFWVLNPARLPKYLMAEKQKISLEDVKMAAYHLSRYIRATA